MNNENDINLQQNIPHSRNTYETELNMLYNIQQMNDVDSEDEYIDESHIINDSFHQENIYVKVFDIENNKELLKNKCYDKTKHKNTSCPIYMVEFKDDDEIVELPCGHCFIPVAIYEWLENQSHCCPFCRYELPFKKIKKNITHSQPEIYPNRPLNAFDIANIQNNDVLLQMLCEVINGNTF
jgi:hypothetical protein